MLLLSIPLALVPRRYLGRFPVTMGPNPIFTSSALQFPPYGHSQKFEKGVMLSCGKKKSVEFYNIGY
jgi:hypothetical protein